MAAAYAIALVLLVAGPAWSQSTASMSAKLPLDPAIHVGKLPNGITFLLRHTGTATALRTGLASLEAMLLERGFYGPGTSNELPNAVVEVRDGR